MLTDVVIPTSTGFDTVKDNLGKVRNRGIEAKLSYTLWQGKQGFFNLFGSIAYNKNIIINLTELHNALTSSPKFPFYSAAYFKALPFIVELRNKNGKKEEPELETCFEALYGLLLLRLQKKPVSEGTMKAVEAISSFLSMLANYYDKDLKGELKLDE